MSKLSDFLLGLGFGEKIVGTEKISAREVQKALLENLIIAGFLKKDNLKDALKEVFKDQKEHESGYNFLKEAILESKASNRRELSEFNSEYLLANMFEDQFFKEEIINEIFSFLNAGLAEVPKSQEARYLTNSEKLGFFEKKNPSRRQYDESWIQGGSSTEIKERLDYLQLLKQSGIDVGLIKIIAAEDQILRARRYYPRALEKDLEEIFIEPEGGKEYGNAVGEILKRRFKIKDSAMDDVNVMIVKNQPETEKDQAKNELYYEVSKNSFAKGREVFLVENISDTYVKSKAPEIIFEGVGDEISVQNKNANLINEILRDLMESRLVKFASFKERNSAAQPKSDEEDERKISPKLEILKPSARRITGSIAELSIK